MNQVMEPQLYHTPKNVGITFMDPAYDEPFALQDDATSADGSCMAA
jgi:hypothetical protein